ncbi:histidine phosphatase family protein [Akkermansiaceae bacterium]|nr:histidine phosphatase family protein [Akkermansiaceae bacterium]
MKRLILSRHAKSSWDNPELRDIDRPLNKRGLCSAPVMGKALVARGFIPEVILASPSVRTRMTADLLSEELDFPKDEIQIIDSFYGASAAEVVAVMNRLPDEVDCALLVGHNPTWTDLVNRLTGGRLVNLPTTGIVVIDFSVGSWTLAEQGTEVATLIPRGLMD